MEPDSSSVAFRLPILYRDALDAIASLEHDGQRMLAGRLRRDAQSAYASSWDEDTCRRLIHLAERARGLLKATTPRKRPIASPAGWLGGWLGAAVTRR